MAIETQIVLIHGAQSGFFDMLSLSDVKVLKEYIIRLGEYSPFSQFINVNDKLSAFEDNVNAILELALSECEKLKA